MTREPLSIVAADDPVFCELYAKGIDLLNPPGWKRFKTLQIINPDVSGLQTMQS